MRLPWFDNYRFEAVSKGEPKIEFTGSYGYHGGEIRDEYAGRLLGYYGQKHALNFLRKYHSRLAVDVTTYVSYDFKENVKLVGFEKLIGDESLHLSISYKIYLFDIVNEANKEEILIGIKDYLTEMRKYRGNEYSFIVNFWDGSFLKSRNFDELRFGFNKAGLDCIDSTVIKRQYIKQGLRFEFPSDYTDSITVDSLYKYIGPYENGKGYKKVYFGRKEQGYE